jgi:hypothetical protein
LDHPPILFFGLAEWETLSVRAAIAVTERNGYKSAPSLLELVVSSPTRDTTRYVRKVQLCLRPDRSSTGDTSLSHSIPPARQSII